MGSGELYRNYVKILSLCYLAAVGLRLLDVLDLRLHFSSMSLLAQAWTIYLLLSDSVAAVSLWRPSKLGELVFVLTVLTQLVVFVAWSPYLADQAFVVAFHLITLSGFLVLLTYRAHHPEPKENP